MSDIHKEKHFESELVSHLTQNGWLEGEDTGYNPQRALYPEDALYWVKTTYPKEWEKFTDANGVKAEEAFLDKLEKELEQSGTLSVLRHGFKIAGLGAVRIKMSTFKPSLSFNEDEITKYKAVRCRVVRQVHYSPHRPGESIDIVLFVNGLPVATLELKTDLTQSVHNAIDQYKYDRPTKDPKTKAREPLLQFKSRAVIHFAVSTSEVWMTTRLNDGATSFLPFNQGYDEGAGNPPCDDKCATAYLWVKILERDNWLHILAKFVHFQRIEKQNPDGTVRRTEAIIFPRYHQWEAVTNLIHSSRTDGTGKRYLIQHSAGSGKSNSIAWLAHHLSTLHDSDDKRCFDSVIVITDRNVLDSQLQETIYQFDHKAGVVECITSKSGAKSEKLTKALQGKKPIIIVTIQTFSFVLQKLSSDALAEHKFAVIADEAHTSQTGAAAGEMRRVLGNMPWDNDDDEISLEDIITAAASSRYGRGNISFYAFTATPKAKTMQLFGIPNKEGGFDPFHSYSMKQAIEEGFIRDVLENYISYKVAYKLAHDGKEYDEDLVDKSEAGKALNRWVRLHPYNITQKVKIIVEHFREHVQWRLDGQAKAMVVTSSRAEVVRYKLAIDKYLKECGYNYGTLVAFSGEIRDKELGPDGFTESSMNPETRGQEIREVFNGEEYQLLLVANKYQTGFDQPKLVAMYVDKRLSGVATVQTLSRLNRIYPNKDFTVVLDFVNDPQQVLEDFQMYYKTCRLPEGVDPNVIYVLQCKLDADGLYTEAEADSFGDAYFAAGAKELTHNRLNGLLSPILQRFAGRVAKVKTEKDTEGYDALLMLVKDLSSFCRLYEFLSQIIDFADAELEIRYVLFKHLIHQLRDILKKEIPPSGKIDLSKIRLTHYAVREKSAGGLYLNSEIESTPGKVGEQGTGTARTREQIELAQLVEMLNEIFEGELTDNDMVGYANSVRDKLMEDDELVKQAQNNSKDRFAEGKIRQSVPEAVIAHLESNNAMAKQVLSSEKSLGLFITLLSNMFYDAVRGEKREEVGS